MKTIFIFLIMVIMVGIVNAVQPERKPFIQIKIDGIPIKTGDLLTVTAGQKLKMEVDMQGGRRDFCKFPETYSDIAGTAQILSRGELGMTYLLNDKKIEWKLLKENFQFTSDDFIKITSPENQSSAELIVSSNKFSQSFVKVTIKAIWQYIEDGITLQEENVAEALVYFKIAGSSDVWFLSPNIKVSGIKNELIQEKLVEVQAACDSIEKYLYKLNFAAVQQSIRNLQSIANNLKLTIDQITASNPSYHTKILFIGLPSDRPYSDIGLLSTIKTNWSSLESFLTELKQELGKLPGQAADESKNELIKLVSSYADWQSKLPAETFDHLSQYIPDIQMDSIQIPEKIERIVKEKSIDDYSQTLNDFNSFIDQRVRNASIETQGINSVNTRIQAVRLFDGMLRSYFASISWAEWVGTRQ